MYSIFCDAVPMRLMPNAAHLPSCSAWSASVLLGVHNLQAPEPTALLQDVAEVLPHPDWDPAYPWAADVALLRLQQPVQLTGRRQHT